MPVHVPIANMRLRLRILQWAFSPFYFTMQKEWVNGSAKATKIVFSAFDIAVNIAVDSKQPKRAHLLAHSALNLRYN